MGGVVILLLLLVFSFFMHLDPLGWRLVLLCIGFGFIGLLRLALVKNAKEENPGEFRDVFHGAGAVGSAHDVAN